MLNLNIDSDEWRKGSNVRNPVESHERLLDRGFRVDHDLLSRLEPF
jgi:hypothetical protein